MEVDEDHMQACKFPRIRSGGSKIGPNGDDEDEGEAKRVASGNDIGRFCGWPSSRIVRVSRASGGKDRHSKVWTSKGLRDRRVRLSVTTAIQFYDLQDRLGYDQPSKAVDWLLKAAESSISELPSLNALPFPNTPKQLSRDEKRSSGGGTTEHGFDSNDLELDMGPNYHHQNQNVSLSKSACSSTSETSKGSGGLSISQSEFRIKPRERPRRKAVEKEKEKESKALISGHHPSVTPISQSFSFTELLTSGANNNRNSAAPHLHKSSSSTQWPNAPMNYFSTGLNQTSSDLSGQIQLGNSLAQAMMVSPINVTSGDQHQHHELQHFSFVQDNVAPVASDYSQNLSISSGLAGYSRGTLQSNLTPSLLPQLHHHHRFSPIDGPNSSPFFTSPAVSIGATTETQHQHHQFPAGFDARLHLYYGADADRHSDHQFPYTSQEKKVNK